MRKSISISELPVGEDLGADIFDNQGQLLLRKGTVLVEELLLALEMKNIETVYIITGEDEIDSNINPKSSVLPIAPSQAIVEKASDSSNQFKFYQIYKDMLFEMRRTALRGKYSKIIQEDVVHGMVDILKIVLAKGSMKELDYFFDVKAGNREYSYETHALNTGILCGIIGNWIELNMHSVVEAALTGSLHDIGKNRISPNVLNKKGKLSAEEWKSIKEHPVTGAAILYKTKWIMPSVIMGVLRHHERLDGSGYPGNCLGSEIPLYARIVAVAEAYDTVTSIRPYAPAMTSFEAIAHLRDQSFGQLDARITRTLYDKVLEYYLGKKVQLSNGDTGVIIQLDDKLPRPLVKTGNGYYDLSNKIAPSIVRVL